MKFLLILQVMIYASTCFGFHRLLPLKTNQYKDGTQMLTIKRNTVKREMLLAPQILFVGACVAAVVSYVWNNIDEIREKQAIAIKETMTKQNDDLKTTQDNQREAIRKVQEEQGKAVSKLQEEARQRAAGKK